MVGKRDLRNDAPMEVAATRRGLLRAVAATTAVGTGGGAGCIEVTTPADLAAQNEIRGNVGYFVGPAWLEAHRDGVTVLDARDRRRFRRERIYGARWVPFETITGVRETTSGLEPDVDAYATALGALGLVPEEDVVVYGASVGSRVTRIVYALHLSVHRGAIHILNGGLDAWNGRIGTGPMRTVDAMAYDPDPGQDLWVSREWIADRIGSFNEGGPGLIDIRPPEAYLAAAGSTALDSTHERHGHLPGAINVHWIGNVNGRRMTDPATLSHLYEDEAGLDSGSPTVVYGDGNIDPTSTWVTLRAIGFEDVLCYEGGFGEWANVSGDRGRYPVETATNVVLETEGSVGGDGDSGDFSCTG